MDVLTAIKERRSCRKFSPDPVDDEQIQTILEAAVCAPSPLNAQPWEFVVITSDAVKEKIADYIDPPRVYPMIGPAQQHHAHYKCTIFYEDVQRIGWPVPHTIRDEDAREVIYIDHNHLHMVGNVDPGHHHPCSAGSRPDRTAARCIFCADRGR